MEIEFTDRYKALGIPYPEPETMCNGQCEGTGWIPVYCKITPANTSMCEKEEDERLIQAWEKAHAEAHNLTGILKTCMDFLKNGKIKWAVSHLWQDWKCDGWHTVECPDCNGTGKRR